MPLKCAYCGRDIHMIRRTFPDKTNLIVAMKCSNLLYSNWVNSYSDDNKHFFVDYITEKKVSDVVFKAIQFGNRVMHKIRNDLGIKIINNHISGNENDWEKWFELLISGVGSLLPFNYETQNLYPSFFCQRTEDSSLSLRHNYNVQEWRLRRRIAEVLQKKVGTCEEIGAFTYHLFRYTLSVDQSILLLLDLYLHHLYCIFSVKDRGGAEVTLVVDPWAYFSQTVLFDDNYYFYDGKDDDTIIIRNKQGKLVSLSNSGAFDAGHLNPFDVLNKYFDETYSNALNVLKEKPYPKNNYDSKINDVKLKVPTQYREKIKFKKFTQPYVSDKSPGRWTIYNRKFPGHFSFYDPNKLSYAVEEGILREVKRWCLPETVNIRCSNTYPLIHMACETGNDEIIKILLKNGVRVISTTEYNGKDRDIMRMLKNYRR